MKKVAAVLLALLTIACNKDKNKDEATPAPTNDTSGTTKSDFLFIPRRDVSWVVHFRGIYLQVPGGYAFDTNRHYYTYMNSINVDTLVDGYLYTKYHREIHEFYPPNSDRVFDIKDYYIAEDTVNQRLIYGWGAGKYYLPFYNLTGTPEIVPGDSLVIDGRKYPRWNSRLNNKENFYSAYGVTFRCGLVGPYPVDFMNGNGAEFRSMEFRYKADTLRFNFDF